MRELIGNSDEIIILKKKNATSVTGRGGPYVCVTSRLPYFIENRLTDSGEVVSLTHRPSL
jgi:hypothetical protein